MGSQQSSLLEATGSLAKILEDDRAQETLTQTEPHRPHAGVKAHGRGHNTLTLPNLTDPMLHDVKTHGRGQNLLTHPLNGSQAGVKICGVQA